MPKKITTRYLIRNKLHQTIGDFSEEEIVSQIRRGKFSGEEEAAPAPSSNWNKLSSYPVFYDALIGRALGIKTTADLPGEGSAASAPVEQSSSSQPAEVGGVATEVFGGGGLPEKEDRQDATAQLPAQGSVSPVISESEIAALFSESGEAGGSSEGDLLKKELSDLDVLAEPDAPPQKKANNNKKRLILWGAVGALLIFLFQSGEKSPNSNKESSNSAVPNGDGEISATEGEDRRTFLTKSAEQALQNDSPLAYAAAADFYQKAIELNPSDLNLHDGLTISLARCLESDPTNKAKTTALEKALKQGRALEPQRTSFFRAEAIVARARGENDKASAHLEHALESDSLNPDNLLVQAEWFVQDKKFPEAVPLLKSILNVSQENIRATYLLALSEFELGRLEESWSLSQRVTQINPAHAATYALMGDILSKRNDLKAAKAVYLLSAKFAQLASKEGADYALWRAGNLSELGGDDQETKRLYVLVYSLNRKHQKDALEKIKEEPQEAEIQKAQSQVYADAAYFERLGSEAITAKNYERAEGFYLAATLTFPSIGKLWTRLGETREALARSRDEFRWAAMTYEKATQVSPEEADAYLRLGLLETEQSNWSRAFQALQKAEEIAPEDPLVQLALGKHFFARKDFRAANERLRTARRINPTIAEVSYYQGMLYKLFDPENPKAAIRNFEEAYSKDPGNYDALAEWLKLKVVTFEKMFAVKFLRNMLAADSHNPQLLWAFGEVYSANKEFNRAIQYYQKALDIDKNAPKVRLSMARALASLGRIDEAISEYKLASDLDAKNGEGYFYAAELLHQIKNYSMARDLLQGLLKIVPNYPGARRLLAMSYQAMNQSELAIREMTLEARANPMNYQFAIELAELYMANQKFVEATNELASITNLPIEKTVPDQRSPTGFKKELTGLKGYRVKGLLLLSKSYRQLRRFEAADGAIQSALVLDPENLDLKLERGFVFHSLGRYTEAAKDFNEFLNKDPNSSEAPAVREILRTTVIEE
ncbi:MAG: hypothetical protein EBQ92_05270 [Proteobacteria bacterium]|nr:hypothetical protein [Pseudomonadota bacterium]